MVLFNIPVNLVILVIVLLEIIIFWNQLLSYLARPYEKQRLWHTILVGLLILYNLAENLVVMPDKNIPIPILIQTIINQGFGYYVTAYMPFYGYKTMGLPRLRFHSRFGYLFIVIPTTFFYFIYYPVTLDLEGTLQYAFIIPGIYATTALTAVVRAIILQYREDRKRDALWDRLWILAALFFWCSSPLIGAFGGQPNWVVGVFNNVVFLLLNISLMRQTIRKSREEYRLLQESNKTLAQRVDEKTEQLRRSNEQRTNAFVNLVHETKTPITLINNYLEEYIAKHGFNEDLLIVKRNLDKLNNDISNLFDLERYNKGLAVYNYTQIVNFSQMLADNLVLFKNYYRKKKLTLHESIAENILIKADPDALNRIINNLVENAIKYTDKGGEIWVVLEDAMNKARFSVNDNGPGIDPALHKKVFEPYYQINTEKKSAQGMGLGLPIVKKMVDSLQGQIIINSDPKKRRGTGITILLDKHITAVDDVIATDLKISNATGLDIENYDISDTIYDDNKQTILLVEDNYAMVSYLLKKLKDNYNVCVALNGNEALKKIKDYPVSPDLIISDVMMDKVDGFKFARIISEDSNYNHIPFIFLSAKLTSKDKTQGLSLGAMDYIQKPFRIDELIHKINSVLENASRQKKTLLTNTMKALKMIEKKEVRHKEEVKTGGFEQNCSIYNLTSREVDIAKLICEGHSYKLIGETLFIAERTVKKHVQNIFEKVGISNKVQLINKLQA